MRLSFAALALLAMSSETPPPRRPRPEPEPDPQPEPRPARGTLVLQGAGERVELRNVDIEVVASTARERAYDTPWYEPAYASPPVRPRVLAAREEAAETKRQRRAARNLRLAGGAR